MRLSLSLLAAAALAALQPLPAAAQARYGERPPLVVSPDLSAPWVLQLQRAPQGQRQHMPQNRLPAGYSVRVAPPPAPAPAPDRRKASAPDRVRTAGCCAEDRSEISAADGGV
jgi:hypothetical protein